MSVLAINYNEINTVISAANSISRKADEYANNLSWSVSGRIDSVTGGANDILTSSKYYVDAKINKLRSKSYAYGALANRINNFAENARKIDKQVARIIAYEKTRFQNTTGLGAKGPAAGFIEWLVGLKNKCPILEYIGNINSRLSTYIKSIKDEIRHWYEFEGGKEWLAYGRAIVGAVVALALFIVTLPASGFIAICAAIGAAIAAINAIYNVYSSVKSYEAARNGDPAWAKIYGDEDKLTDFFRRHNFGSKRLNQVMDVVSFGIDGAELFTGVVSIGAGIKKLADKPFKLKCLNKYFDSKNGLLSYMKTDKTILKISRDSKGKYVGIIKKTQVFTKAKVTNTLKAYVANSPIDTKSSEGLRTMLNNNFKSDVRKFFTPSGFKEAIKPEKVEFIFEKGADWMDRREGIKNVANIVGDVNTVAEKVHVIEGNTDVKDLAEFVGKKNPEFKIAMKIGDSFSDGKKFLDNSLKYHCAY